MNREKPEKRQHGRLFRATGLILMLIWVVTICLYLLIDSSLWIPLLSTPFAVIGYIMFEPAIAPQLHKPVRIVLPAIAVLMGLVAAIVPLKTASEPPTAAESCMQEAESTKDELSRQIDLLYCQTQYAKIWQPEEPTMLEDNKQLLAAHPDWLTTNQFSPDDSHFSAEALADIGQDNVGGKLNYIFQRWPKYQSRSFIVVGTVLNKYQLTSDGSRSDWVFELGTTRNMTQSIHVQLVRPASWEPPEAEHCEIALTEVYPIARGRIPSATDASTTDAIYSIGKLFQCAPGLDPHDAQRLYESMTEEQRELFDEGRSQD